MRHRGSLRPALLAALPLLAAFLGLGPASAATRVWPSFDCLQTLQQCVYFAASGDVVEVASQGPIAESITIEGKSLTLRPHSGFIPVLAENHSITARGGPANVIVTIEGMTLMSGRLVARQAGAGTFDVRLLDNTILDSVNASALHVTSNTTQPPYGAILFTVSGNRISSIETELSSQRGGIEIGPFLSPSSGKVTGNTILLAGVTTHQGAIDITNGSTTMTIDVLNNEVRGARFNAGISLLQFGDAGLLTARVINNLVVGQFSSATVPGGIFLSAFDGTLNARVVNNTIVGGDVGFLASGRVDLGGQILGVLANNLVVGHRGIGILISSFFETTFVNDHNLSFRNVNDFFVPGPGTLLVDPLFLTGNDYRLRSNSPARNAGSNAHVPADITTDLAGAARIQGAAVAMGVYER